MFVRVDVKQTVPDSVNYDNILIAASFTVFNYVTCDALPDIQSISTSSLLTMLRKFKGARNHKSQLQGKKEARDFIIETFKNNGLDVWTEREKIGNFKVGQQTIPASTSFDLALQLNPLPQLEKPVSKSVKFC